MFRKVKNWWTARLEAKAHKGFKGSLVAMTQANKNLIDEKARVAREIAEKQEREVGYAGQIDKNGNLIDAIAAVLEKVGE